jgi:hypothetical protein
MKLTGKQSKNIEDVRRDRIPKAPSRNPFSYAEKHAIDQSRTAYVARENKPIKNNPMAKALEGAERQMKSAADAQKKRIGKEIGQLGREHWSGNKVRSRAPRNAYGQED